MAPEANSVANDVFWVSRPRFLLFVAVPAKRHVIRTKHQKMTRGQDELRLLAPKKTEAHINLCAIQSKTKS